MLLPPGGGTFGRTGKIRGERLEPDLNRHHEAISALLAPLTGPGCEKVLAAVDLVELDLAIRVLGWRKEVVVADDGLVVLG